eukprot:g4288.t1
MSNVYVICRCFQSIRPNVEELDGNVEARKEEAPPSHHRKLTLVLDLDETLIHSSPRRKAHYDFVIHVYIEDVGSFVPFYVSCRPFLARFLRVTSRWYHIVIFTASRQKYADKIIDHIDTYGAISRRLYRGSCTPVNLDVARGFAKNLQQIRRNVGKVILLDNSPISFYFNRDNGILVKGWTEDPNDSALRDLIPLLELLSHASDVRFLLSRRTGNRSGAMRLSP